MYFWKYHKVARLFKVSVYHNWDNITDYLKIHEIFLEKTISAIRVAGLVVSALEIKGSEFG